MQYLRSKLFDAFLLLWTLAVGASIPFFVMAGRPQQPIRAFSRFWSRGVIRALGAIVGLRLREEGTEHKIPATPCLYVSNHQSPWETIAFNGLLPDVAIVAKEELGRVPVFGWFLKHSPMVLVDRSGGRRALARMLAEARAAIDSGRSMLIFPEGTRIGVHEHKAYQPGVAGLYAKLNVPVVPVAHNSGCFWNDKSGMKYGGEIIVSYLPAIQPGLSADEFMRTLEATINAEKDRLAGNPGVADRLPTAG